MTNDTNMPDAQHYQRIIEAATLGRKLYHMGDGDEGLEQTSLAFEEALSGLAPGDRVAVMMVVKLLDGSPYVVTSNKRDNIRLCIAIAQKIGATVVDYDHNKTMPDARTITISPPSQTKQ